MTDNRRLSLRVAPVQKTLTLRIIAYLVVFLAMSSVVDLAMQILGSPFEDFSTHLSQFLERQKMHALVLLCLLPVFIRDSLRFSHRFAGPIVRFQGVLRRINDGEQESLVVLRKGDYWKDLAGEVNTLIGTVARLNAEAAAPRSEVPEPEKVQS